MFHYEMTTTKYEKKILGNFVVCPCIVKSLDNCFSHTNLDSILKSAHKVKGCLEL